MGLSKPVWEPQSLGAPWACLSLYGSLSLLEPHGLPKPVWEPQSLGAQWACLSLYGSLNLLQPHGFA